jgi:hypothetical protein
VILRICVALLGVYPRAWRDRYQDEVIELLEQSPVCYATALDLARGVLDAHLYPCPVAVPRERMRSTVSATLACWLAFVILGSGFAKGTEDIPFRRAGQSHALLGATRSAIVALAFIAGIALMVGGAPLLVVLVRQVWRERGPALFGALLVPIVAVTAFYGRDGRTDRDRPRRSWPDRVRRPARSVRGVGGTRDRCGRSLRTRRGRRT